MIKFWHELLEISIIINEKIENPIKYVKEEKKLNKPRICWICEKTFKRNS
jgi:hypothetical protein